MSVIGTLVAVLKLLERRAARGAMLLKLSLAGKDGTPRDGVTRSSGIDPIDNGRALRGFFVVALVPRGIGVARTSDEAGAESRFDFVAVAGAGVAESISLAAASCRFQVEASCCFACSLYIAVSCLLWITPIPKLYSPQVQY